MSQTSFRQIKKSRTWSETCLRPGLRQVGDLVSDKIDLMEFGQKRAVDFLLVLIELFSLGVTVEALRANID